jgi:pimeloyl-ACP methyl ester carboxylesterase
LRVPSITLPDDRSLTYGAYGAEHGPTVLVLDGPGSRGLARAAAPAATGLGIRLIAPDRPGFGGSAPLPGRRIADFPADALALADAVGAERFGLLCQSGGTPFGLAVAAAAPERVGGVSFVGAISPLGEKGALQDVSGPLKPAFRLARRAPWLLRRLVKATSGGDPEKAAKRFAKSSPAPDREALKDPRLWQIHLKGTAEIQRSPEQFAEEAILLARPWDIDLGAVRSPVRFWVGELDATHPPVMSRRMSERLGGAPVHVVPGVSTFSISGSYPAALAHAVSSAPSWPGSDSDSPRSAAPAT